MANHYKGTLMIPFKKQVTLNIFVKKAAQQWLPKRQQTIQ